MRCDNRLLDKEIVRGICHISRGKGEIAGEVEVREIDGDRRERGEEKRRQKL